jgi:cytochrome b involved in lipid metabolism
METKRVVNLVVIALALLICTSNRSCLGQTVYTAEEVAEHASADDLWVVLDGKVYDITSWLPQHPGGAAVLLGNPGLDFEEAFLRKHGRNPERQYAILETLYIGDLA